MQVGPTILLDHSAEVFRAHYVRLKLTAVDETWLGHLLTALTGYGSSLIGCDCEIGVETLLTPEESPDTSPNRRPGASVLAFGFRQQELGRAIAQRVGQTVLTCPSAEIEDGLSDTADRVAMGDYLRFFGDGSEELVGEQSWQIPIMEGTVSLPRTVGTKRGIAGGNLILQGADSSKLLGAAQRAVETLKDRPGMITPFPGGVCRSGSKVGSRYKKLVASTNEQFCPTLRDQVDSQLIEGATCAYEIIINGVDEETVRSGMRAAIQAAAGDEVLAIGAGSYGGRLGKTLIPLQELAGS